MGAKENVAVVRRFWDELISAGKLEVADELLAPDYVNFLYEAPATADPAIQAPQSSENGGDAVAKLKEAITSFLAGLKEVRFEPSAIAAEGDSVFARFNIVATKPDGTTTTARALGYYKLANGKIILNDVMSIPA